MGILDVFFPKYCVSCKKVGSYLCADCFSRISFDTRLPCSECNRFSFSGLTHPGCKKRYSLDGMFASLIYSRPVKKLIASFKYKPYVSDLYHLLGAFFIEGIIQEETFMRSLTKDTVFVPIPLHASKLRHRGYNHAELLTKPLSTYFALPMRRDLVRVKKTVSQYGLPRDERQKNLKGAFALKHPLSVKQVILVDDIVTSGTTFSEATTVLKKSGVEKVYGIALAHGL